MFSFSLLVFLFHVWIFAYIFPKVHNVPSHIWWWRPTFADVREKYIWKHFILWLCMLAEILRPSGYLKTKQNKIIPYGPSEAPKNSFSSTWLIALPPHRSPSSSLLIVQPFTSVFTCPGRNIFFPLGFLGYELVSFVDAGFPIFFCRIEYQSMFAELGPYLHANLTRKN